MISTNIGITKATERTYILMAATLLRLMLLLSLYPYTRSYSCENARNNFIGDFNCGQGQCVCVKNSAYCIGNESLSQLPQLWDNITDITIECYYFFNLGKTVFDNIKTLKLITAVRLNNVKIGHINNDTFQDFEVLNQLDLSKNPGINITDLSTALGSIQKHFQIELYLDYISASSDVPNVLTFDLLNKTNVAKLSLNGNHLTKLNISDLQGFTNLTCLYLRNNWIHAIEGNAQLPALKTLDLRWNRFQDEGNINFCNNETSSIFPNLTHLLLNNNYISSLQAKSIECLKTLAILDLSNNTIKNLRMSIFSALTSLKLLNLSSNWLQNVTPGLFPQTLTTIDFGNNEFVQFPPKLCVNETVVFPNITNIDITRNYIRTSKYFRNWSCLNGLEALDVGRNDISVFFNNSFSMFPKLRNLSLGSMVSGIQDIHQFAFNSSSLTHLNLSHNLLKVGISTKAVFEACPNVTILDLSYNLLDSDNSSIAQILSPLQGITSLYLQHTFLKMFPIDILLKLPSLNLLNLDRNHLEYWSFPDNFSITLNLHELSLRSNFIRNLDERCIPSQLQHSLRILALENNPFDCTCKSLWFKNWMDKTNVILTNKDSYKCRTPIELNGTLLVKFDVAKACQKHDPWIIVYATIGSFVFVFIVLFIIVHKYKWYLQYYCLKLKKNLYVRQDGQETDPLLYREEVAYDGYVIYNEADGPFVHYDFRRLIENTCHYRLHIWERNAACGEARIDVVFDAMDASRRFIAIISKHAIQDPWFQFQMNVCFDMSVEHRKNGLILVVLEDVDFQSLSKSWCVLLTKTPTAHWCGITTDIRHSLFIDRITQHFGQPIVQ